MGVDKNIIDEATGLLALRNFFEGKRQSIAFSNMDERHRSRWKDSREEVQIERLLTPGQGATISDQAIFQIDEEDDNSNDDDDNSEDDDDNSNDDDDNSNADDNTDNVNDNAHSDADDGDH